MHKEELEGLPETPEVYRIGQQYLSLLTTARDTVKAAREFRDTKLIPAMQNAGVQVIEVQSVSLILDESARIKIKRK